MSEKPEPLPTEAADPDWFREPNRRELKIGFWLFSGFGVFFILLFFVEKAFWFRWVILGLGIISLIRGLYHGSQAMRRRSHE